MQRGLLRHLLVPALACLSGACGSDAGTSSKQAGAPPSCESLAAAQCDYLSRCYTGGLGTARLSESNCRDRIALDCEAWLLPGMDAASWLSCNTAAYAARCELAIDLMNGCARLPGTNPNGAACMIGNQCLSGGCKHVAAATCGTCATAAAQGESCGAAPCSSGLLCSDGKCTGPATDPPIQEGDPCVDPWCASYLRCVDGRCVRFVDEGGSCDGPGDCNLDLACEGGTCVPVPAIAEGQACQASEDCVDGTACALLESGGSVCVALLEDGEPCHATFGPPCTFPASCQNGVCNLRKAPVCE